MKIAIFGAAGKVGRHLLDQALERGDEVSVLVRDTSKLTIQRHEGLKVVQGDVLDPKDVEKAVVGTRAVLSALGHTKTSSKDVLTEGTKNIVAAMNEHGVRRLVSLTGGGQRPQRRAQAHRQGHRYPSQVPAKGPPGGLDRTGAGDKGERPRVGDRTGTGAKRRREDGEIPCRLRRQRERHQAL